MPNRYSNKFNKQTEACMLIVIDLTLINKIILVHKLCSAYFSPNEDDSCSMHHKLPKA